jgi:hypothetical protein
MVGEVDLANMSAAEGMQNAIGWPIEAFAF